MGGIRGVETDIHRFDGIGRRSAGEGRKRQCSKRERSKRRGAKKCQEKTYDYSHTNGTDHGLPRIPNFAQVFEHAVANDACFRNCRSIASWETFNLKFTLRLDCCSHFNSPYRLMCES